MIGSCRAPIDAATELEGARGRNIASAKQRQLEWESLDLRQAHLATLALHLVGLPVGLILPYLVGHVGISIPDIFAFCVLFFSRDARHSPIPH